jgi:hypothetical protein
VLRARLCLIFSLTEVSAWPLGRTLRGLPPLGVLGVVFGVRGALLGVAPGVVLGALIGIVLGVLGALLGVAPGVVLGGPRNLGPPLGVLGATRASLLSARSSPDSACVLSEVLIFFGVRRPRWNPFA